MIANKDTILFAGDSTTDADKKTTFLELGNGYVKLIFHFLRAFCPQNQYFVINAGVSGNTSRDLLARWEQDVLAKKPDIVFYGESLNTSMLIRAENAFTNADLSIVLGSSLVVNPAASLPYNAVRAGKDIVIVNRTETYLDRYAALRFDDLESFFAQLSAALADA